MVPFKYDGKKALQGSFRSFTNFIKGKVAYSIVMAVDETNEKFFQNLKERIIKRAKFSHNYPMSDMMAASSF